jgi:cytochrome c-type biogenesis protein CcmF
VSREGALVLNNLLLTTCCATVFVGTLYPLALESVTGEKISVGAPFFNLTFGPLFVPIMLVMPLGQMLAWKRGDLLGAAQRLMVALAVGFAVALLFGALRGGPVLSIVGVAIAAYLVVGSCVEVYGRIAGRGVTLGGAISRAMGLPRSAWGTAFAHAGIGV